MKKAGFIGAVTVVLCLAVIAACESHARAKQLIVQNKCTDCHTIKGKGGAVGPNLTYVGSKRSREYIYQQIKDPKSHNPKTEMPSFGERISEQDINDLADYLASMK